MSIRARRTGGIACVALALVFVAGGAARATEPDPEQTRRIMREVYEALHRVLPASLNDERFAAPEQRAEVQQALGTLARHADALAAHGSREGGSFVFLSRSLARDARDAERRYAAGHPSEAAFVLHELTETCVACHSRLPDRDDAPIAAGFLDEQQIAALPLPERARLAMATRQFDRALAAQEAMFASPEFDVSSIDLLGYLDDYLEICLRVKNDFERPAATLAVFSQREDVREELRRSVRRWVADLIELRTRGPIEGVAAGRELVRDAERRLGAVEERELLVRYQVASGALHRALAALDERDPRAAEAYYWLGVIESRIGRSFWLSQTEPYLEAAIRLAPGDPLAREAYALLEEFVVSGYTGSAGENVPEDVKAWLAELAHLIESASASDEVARDEIAARVARGVAPLILDVRSPQEYARGHVPGARNLPHDRLAERVDELAEHREREVVVYCESGRRAAMAAETLEAAGFRGVRHLEGDMAGWRDAGLPTE